jgi:hypothetical protein
MANNNGADYSAQISQGMKTVQHLQEQHRRDCNHKPQGNRRVIPVQDWKGYLPDKDKLPESTAYCTGCGAVFEADSYKRDETSSGLYMFTSMLHQIKMVANLSDEDKQMIQKGFEALDTLAIVTTYYDNMVEKLGSNKGNKRNRSNNKGHIGVDSGMFGGARNY